MQPDLNAVNKRLQALKHGWMVVNSDRVVLV
jgi:hypothetical protein